MKSEVHYGFTNVSYNTKISLYLATPWVCDFVIRVLLSQAQAQPDGALLV